MAVTKKTTKAAKGIKKSIKKLSKTSGHKMTPGYEITVRGQYHASSEKGRVPKFFKEVTFTLPLISEYKEGQKWEDKEIKDPISGEVTHTKKVSVPKIIRQNTLHCANHIIQRYHIVPYLRENYADFAALRECEILRHRKVMVPYELSRKITETPVSQMSESQLLMFVSIHNMVITLNSYPDLLNKREAVKRAYEATTKKKADELNRETSYDVNLNEPEGFVFAEDGSENESLQASNVGFQEGPDAEDNPDGQKEGDALWDL